MIVTDAVPESLRTAFADRYDIERELGHGGMATVYLGRDRKHDRLVALKVRVAAGSADAGWAPSAAAGTSWGGAMGGLMMGVEPGFRTAILVVAGFPMSRPRPEVDVLNFLPRVHAPVIMLNAKYDHFFPPETSQKPYFRWLGTPPADKKLVMHESGHFLLRSQMIGESLAWLDHYLGPVTR